MSRSRRAAGAVRGPASALTSFLAGLGVEPPTRLSTWGHTSDVTGEASEAPQLAHDGPVIDPSELDPAGAVTARNVVAGPSVVGEGTPDLDEAMGSTSRKRQAESSPSKSDAPVTKRVRAASVDSDDLDAEAAPGPSKKASPVKRTGAKVDPAPLKSVGEFMDCGECGKKFTVTGYTKEHPNNESTYLCVQCCYALGIDPFAKAKKGAAKKKPPAKKENRAKIMHYEERKGVSSLGDLCIETASLFYSVDRDTLEMYDCTRLTPDSFITMGKLCPKLTSLRLHLCGQLSTEAVEFWGKSLKHLKRLELFAPFLVRKAGWLSFIKAAGKRLEGLLVTQSPRIDLEIIEALAKSCPNLTELRLAEIGQLNDDCLTPLHRLKKLKFLDLSSPGTPLTDQAVVDLITAVGSTLESLTLDDNSDLTDEILSAIVEHCPRLRRLSLRHLPELTDEGVAQFFNSLRKNKHPGLEQIDLEKGHDLKDKALRALIGHSGGTVEKLSLLGWREVAADALGELAKCDHLKELNMGWCRQVTDYSVKEVLDGCDAIEVIRVWGCNQLSDAIPRKKGVKVIGVETHSI